MTDSLRETNTRISFVVPVYNTEKYLRQCIKSLCTQEDQSIEILLVDDGSTDSSPAICDEFAEADPRVKVIHQDNQGVSVARNRGLACANGEWVCFIDSDDFIDAGFTEYISPYLINEYDIVYFGYRDINQNKKSKCNERPFTTNRLNRKDFLEIRRIIFNPKTSVKKYARYSDMQYTAPWGKCYNRDFLKRIDAKFIPGIKRAQDALFNVLVCGNAKKGIYVSETFYNYRVISNSVTRKYHPDAVRTAEQLIECYKKYLYDIPQKEYPELDIMIFRQLMYCVVLDFCHKDNPKCYKERKQDFFLAVSSGLFQESINKANIKEMRIQEYVIAILIRHRCFGLINLLNKVRTI